MVFGCHLTCRDNPKRSLHIHSKLRKTSQGEKGLNPLLGADEIMTVSSSPGITVAYTYELSTCSSSENEIPNKSKARLKHKSWMGDERASVTFLYSFVTYFEYSERETDEGWVFKGIFCDIGVIALSSISAYRYWESTPVMGMDIELSPPKCKTLKSRAVWLSN